MKLFVMGATGYIGVPVAEYLRADGHELVGLARSAESAEKLAAAGIEPVRGEIGDRDLIESQARKSDGVVQLATAGFLNQAVDGQQALRSTVDGVVAALRGTNKPYIITFGHAMYMDTGAWGDPERVATEEDPATWSRFYAHWGDVQRLLAAEPGVRTIEILPSGTYGRGGGYIGTVSRVFDGVRKHGKVYAVAPGDNGWSKVHIDDLAELYMLALRSPDTRGRFIGAAEIVTMIDQARAVSRAAGLGGEVEFVDYRTMRQLNGRYAEFDWWTNVRTSGQKARNVLGWRPHHPTLIEELDSLPKPLDLWSVYPKRDRQAAAADAARYVPAAPKA